MAITETRRVPIEPIERARAIFSPLNFGFTKCGRTGWKRNFKVLGEITIARIGKENHKVFEMISSLQSDIWQDPQGFGFVSPPKLSTAEDTGGAVFAAYPSAGTSKGIKAFLYGIGGQKRYSSEMLGVSEDVRGEDLGWYMKLIQIDHALENNQTTIYWTYDPLRGPNSFLNIEKLGGEVETYYHDRYGPWSSGFNGDLPTPRFKIKLDLTSPTVQKRIQDVHNENYERLSLEDVADRDKYPVVTAANVDDLINVPTMIYEIPEDVDKLAPDERKEWVLNSQKVFSKLLDTEIPLENSEHPEESYTDKHKRSYKITNVVTGHVWEADMQGGIERKRKTYYVISRKDNI